MFVYITATKNNKMIYIGVTGNLERRIAEHKSGVFGGYTKRFQITKLVYVETYENPKDAIRREKQLKGWIRSKKDALINAANPEWAELYDIS